MLEEVPQTSHSNQLLPAERRMLVSILGSAEDGLGVDALQFRASNARNLSLLDALEAARLLRRDDDRYFVTLSALRRLNSMEAKRILRDSQLLYARLRESYKIGP